MRLWLTSNQCFALFLLGSIICHWNIAEYLPPLAQEYAKPLTLSISCGFTQPDDDLLARYFLVIISEWILEPYKNSLKLKENEAAMDEAEIMTREVSNMRTTCLFDEQHFRLENKACAR